MGEANVLRQDVIQQQAISRGTAPVFIVGCPRSGTTLLYNMLLSSGGFAVYLAESNVFNLLVPRFGDLSVRANREKLMNAWLDSKLFRASFLDARDIREKVTSECQNGGDFIRIVMGEMALTQGHADGLIILPKSCYMLRQSKRSCRMPCSST